MVPSSNRYIAYPFKSDEKMPDLHKGLYTDLIYRGASDTLMLKTISCLADTYTVTWGTATESLIIETLTLPLGPTMSAKNVTSKDTIAYVPYMLQEYLEDMASGTTDVFDYEVESNCIATRAAQLDGVVVGSQVLVGPVKFVPGSNMNPSKAANAVVLDNGPGLGTGFADSCADRPALGYVATINKQPIKYIKPGEEGCYRISKDVSEIFVDNQCSACCDCETYASVFEYYKNLLTDAALLKVDLNAQVTALNTAIATYNENEAKVDLRCTASLTITSKVYTKTCITVINKGGGSTTIRLINDITETYEFINGTSVVSGAEGVNMTDNYQYVAIGPYETCQAIFNNKYTHANCTTTAKVTDVAAQSLVFEKEF